jgi:hypothetical protein
MSLVSFSIVDSIALFLVLSVLFKSVLTYHCSLSLAAYSKLNFPIPNKLFESVLLFLSSLNVA